MFHVKHCGELGASLADAVIEQVEIATKYAGYIDKQNDEVERAAHYESLKLPADLDYAQVTALSIEVRQKLARHRPETLGRRRASPASRRRHLAAADAPEEGWRQEQGACVKRAKSIRP